MYVCSTQVILSSFKMLYTVTYYYRCVLSTCIFLFWWAQMHIQTGKKSKSTQTHKDKTFGSYLYRFACEIEPPKMEGTPKDH